MASAGKVKGVDVQRHPALDAFQEDQIPATVSSRVRSLAEADIRHRACFCGALLVGAAHKLEDSPSDERPQEETEESDPDIFGLASQQWQVSDSDSSDDDCARDLLEAQAVAT